MKLLDICIDFAGIVFLHDLLKFVSCEAQYLFLCYMLIFSVFRKVHILHYMIYIALTDHRGLEKNLWVKLHITHYLGYGLYTFKSHKKLFILFTVRRNALIASAVLATAIPSICLSVCLSVRLSHAGTVSKRLHIARCSLHCQIGICV